MTTQEMLHDAACAQAEACGDDVWVQPMFEVMPDHDPACSICDRGGQPSAAWRTTGTGCGYGPEYPGAVPDYPELS